MDEAATTFHAAVGLFNEGRYLAAHELFEELWEAGEGGDSDFFKGLIQASIALHHYQEANLDGAARLYRGHRQYLAHFLPRHRGIDVDAFLADMQRFLQPVLRRRPEDEVPFPLEGLPRLRAASA